jgi:hypothetical protein
MTSNHTTRTPGSVAPSLRAGETKGMALAHSQHSLSTLSKPRSFRRPFPAALLTVLLGATLGMSACGPQEASSAAIVNGVSISEQDVQSISDQVNALSQGGQKLSSSDALLSLILAPYVRDEARRVHKTVAVSQAKDFINGKIAHPSAATLTFFEMNLAVQGLDQASRNLIVGELDKAKITVNPRYGTFDFKQIRVNPISPNWIKASEASPAR